MKKEEMQDRLEEVKETIKDNPVQGFKDALEILTNITANQTGNNNGIKEDLTKLVKRSFLDKIKIKTMNEESSLTDLEEITELYEVVYKICKQCKLDWREEAQESYESFCELVASIEHFERIKTKSAECKLVLLEEAFKNTIITRIKNSKYSELDLKGVYSLAEMIYTSICCEYDQKKQKKILEPFENYLDLYNYLRRANNPKEEELDDETIDMINEEYNDIKKNNMDFRSEIESSYDVYFKKFAEHLVEKIKNGGSNTSIDNLWERKDGEKGCSFGDIDREKSTIASLLKSGVSSEEIVECFTNMTSVWGLPENKNERDKDSIEIVKRRQKEGFNGILKMYKDLLEDRFLAYLATDEWKNPEYSLMKDPLIKRLLVEGTSQLFMDEIHESVGLVEDKSFFALINQVFNFYNMEEKLLLGVNKLKENEQEALYTIRAGIGELVIGGYLDKIESEKKSFFRKSKIKGKTPPKDEERKRAIMTVYENRDRILEPGIGIDSEVVNKLFEFYGLRSSVLPKEDSVSEVKKAIEDKPLQGFRKALEVLETISSSGNLSDNAEDEKKTITEIVKKTFKDIITMKIVESKFAESDFKDVRDLYQVALIMCNLYDKDGAATVINDYMLFYKWEEKEVTDQVKLIVGPKVNELHALFERINLKGEKSSTDPFGTLGREKRMFNAYAKTPQEKKEMREIMLTIIDSGTDRETGEARNFSSEEEKKQAQIEQVNAYTRLMNKIYARYEDFIDSIIENNGRLPQENMFWSSYAKSFEISSCITANDFFNDPVFQSLLKEQYRLLFSIVRNISLILSSEFASIIEKLNDENLPMCLQSAFIKVQIPVFFNKLTSDIAKYKKSKFWKQKKRKNKKPEVINTIAKKPSDLKEFVPKESEKFYKSFYRLK